MKNLLSKTLSFINDKLYDFFIKKYKLTNNTIQYNGRTLYQIQALKSFGNVKKGDLGGYVGSRYNLCHEDNCWIYKNAKVFGDSLVMDNAKVYGNAVVFDNSLICNNAEVFDNAQVWDHTSIYGNAKICGDANVYNYSNVSHGKFANIALYQIYEHENEQVVYIKNKFIHSAIITYRSNIWNLDETIDSKKEIIKKALQLYKQNVLDKK